MQTMLRDKNVYWQLLDINTVLFTVNHTIASSGEIKLSSSSMSACLVKRLMNIFRSIVHNIKKLRPACFKLPCFFYVLKRSSSYLPFLLAIWTDECSLVLYPLSFPKSAKAPNTSDKIYMPAGLCYSQKTNIGSSNDVESPSYCFAITRVI
ncbi:hypothetical protein BD560DRAFT_423774 [Blakeslea trispora]|nr:hypothetical protein BD560DRAFT_423774 [Blakeslea trispora]